MSLRGKRPLIITATIGAAALLLTACGTGPSSAPTSTPTPDDSTAAVVGMWGTDAAGEPYLEFTEDGTVQGSDGCNGIYSTYTAEGDRIEIAQFASTLKACQGVDDWLRGVRAVQVDGDVLVVLNAAGDRIGELERAE